MFYSLAPDVYNGYMLLLALNVAYCFSCWLSLDRGFIWSFVGPVLVVLAVSQKR